MEHTVSSDHFFPALNELNKIRMEMFAFDIVAPPILCTKEGLWTEEFTLCEHLQGECPPPPSELNSVEYKCEQGYGIGKFGKRC